MIKQREWYLDRVNEILNERSPALPEHIIQQEVQGYLNRRETFLACSRKFGSPLYILDLDYLRTRAKAFQAAFAAHLPSPPDVYYAVKSNHHPLIAETLVKNGLGLDVSSGDELEIALSTGADRIIFSGPGKTTAELELAIRHSHLVTVLIDSFGELRRLHELTRTLSEPLRCGVRLTSDPNGPWRKFGIPPEQLQSFLAEAEKMPGLVVQGLQFHMSWNLNPDRQTAFIRVLSQTLSRLPRASLAPLEFIDLGGGYWPESGERLQWAGTTQGSLIELLDPYSTRGSQRFSLPAKPVEVFAKALGEAVREHLLPLAPLRICLEPGRWICNGCMHILMTVIDQKFDDLVITDAGTNTVGWERFETDFSPVINLTQPGTLETACEIQGCLCTPRDIWGYSYWGKSLQVGDQLMIPDQGAYTFSLRQHFIKPLPRVVTLDDDRLGLA